MIRTIYYLLRIEDHTNIVPEYGAFSTLKDVKAFVATQCSTFGKQLVYNTDGSVIYIKREETKDYDNRMGQL